MSPFCGMSTKDPIELSKELHELTEKTRQRKVSLEELQGGTFTISNQGSIGGGLFTLLSTPPRWRFLGVGQGQPSRSWLRETSLFARCSLFAGVRPPRARRRRCRALSKGDLTGLENFPEAKSNSSKKKGKWNPSKPRLSFWAPDRADILRVLRG